MSAAAVPRAQAALLLSAASGMGVSLILTAAAGRRSEVAGFAVFALAGAFIALARDLLDLGTTAVTVRSALADPGGERRAFDQLLAWRLMAALPLALACLGYLALQPDADGRMLIALTALTVLAMHSNGLIAAFQLHERLEVPALVNIAVQLCTLVLVAALWSRLDDPRAPVLLLLGREIAIVALLHVAARKMLGFLPHVRLSDLRPALFFSVTSRYAAAAFAFHTILHSGTFLLRLMVPTEAFAAYAAAFRLMSTAFSLPWLLTAPLVPGFVRAADSPLTFQTMFDGQMVPALVLASALAAAGAVVTPDILQFVYDGRFLTGAESAVAPMRWLMLAFVGVAAASVRAPALLALGWEAGLLRLAASAALLTAISLTALAFTRGIAGAAAGIALGALAAGLAPVGPAIARLPIHTRTLAALVAAPALAALAASAWPLTSGLPRIAAAGISALAIGLAAARLAQAPMAADA